MDGIGLGVFGGCRGAGRGARLDLNGVGVGFDLVGDIIVGVDGGTADITGEM